MAIQHICRLLAVFVASFATITSSEAQTACPGATIDDFSVNQPLLSLTVPPPAPQAAASVSANSASILGNEREMFLDLIAATSNGGNDVSANSSQLHYDSMTGIAGRFRLVYDGTDNNTGSINFNGLGGANLTAGGGVAFYIVADPDLPTRLQVRLYTDATHFSDLTDAPGGGGTPGFPLTPQGPFAAYVMPFSYVGVGAGAAGPATLSNVGVLEVHVDPVPSLDIKIACISICANLATCVDLLFANGFE